MADYEYSTQIMFCTQKPPKDLFNLSKWDDPEDELRIDALQTEFLDEHTERVQLPGLLSHDKIKDFVAEKGGYAPVTIRHNTHATRVSLTLEEIECLPHTVYREAF